MQTTSSSLSPALVISALALAFTLFSFWWMNWRPGKLHVAKPRSFAILRPSSREILIMRVPLVFMNSGARSLVIQNLRLAIPELSGTDRPLSFNSIAGELDVTSKVSLATQFPVRSREAQLLFCDFVRDPGDVVFQAQSYACELQGLVGDSHKWKPLSRFDLPIVEGALAAANEQNYTALDSFRPVTGGRIAVNRFPGAV